MDFWAWHECATPVYGGSRLDGLFCGSLGNSDPFNGIHGAPGTRPDKIIVVTGPGADIITLFSQPDGISWATAYGVLK